MECFRQIVLLVKTPFGSKKHQVLEIGPPTNFRKEKQSFLFSDDDALTLHSYSSTPEKESKVKAVEQQPSARDKVRHYVRRLSTKAVCPPRIHD